MDIFAIALFFIPFDNLFFAPSKGWAAISPIIFFIYVLFHIKDLERVLSKDRKFFLVLFMVVCIQPILWMIHGFKWDSFIDNFETFVLGIVFYFALIIRYDIYKMNFNNDAVTLYNAYKMSFLYGIIRYISMNYVTSLLPFFSILEKRSYNDRLAFSFTEPSFISMHAIGVLFLYTYFVSDGKLAQNMIKLGISFSGICMLLQSSTRCVFDILVFIGIYLLRVVIIEKTYY